MRLFGEHNGAIDIIDHDRTFGPWDKVAIFKRTHAIAKQRLCYQRFVNAKIFPVLLDGNCDPFLMCEN